MRHSFNVALAQLPCGSWASRWSTGRCIVVLITLVLFGCNSDDARREGYRAGFSAGHTSGYVEGYEAGKSDGYSSGYKDGFEKASPGASLGSPSGLLGGTYKWVVYLGAIEIVIALLIGAYVLAFNSDVTERQLAGKLVIGGLGSLAMLWLSHIVALSSLVQSLLLSPAADSAVAWLLRGTVAAVTVYGALFAFRALFIDADAALWLEAWSLFVVSALLTVLVPIIISMLRNVPDISRYLAADVFPGALLGGGFYIANQLLRSE